MSARYWDSRLLLLETQVQQRQLAKSRILADGTHCINYYARPSVFRRAGVFVLLLIAGAVNFQVFSQQTSRPSSTLAQDTSAQLAVQYIDSYRSNQDSPKALSFLLRGLQLAPDI